MVDITPSWSPVRLDEPLPQLSRLVLTACAPTMEVELQTRNQAHQGFAFDICGIPHAPIAWRGYGSQLFQAFV
ncbi:uncharacterized protein METZ01_LOCUS103168 [marine metagenome]|uniref:Uncharacterized protein n=1 Tax=marine metagenome TaxID=408172 RepID=A0A381WCX6_9ZZZZ